MGDGIRDNARLRTKSVIVDEDGSVLDTYFIMFFDRRRPSEEMIGVRCELWR
jgi:hypothetical protein